ncbi:hypothetical protein PFISCL1PPCAC_13534, partial [Pristionchus fissidentatus]
LVISLCALTALSSALAMSDFVPDFLKKPSLPPREEQQLPDLSEKAAVIYESTEVMTADEDAITKAARPTKPKDFYESIRAVQDKNQEFSESVHKRRVPRGIPLFIEIDERAVRRNVTNPPSILTVLSEMREEGLKKQSRRMKMRQQIVKRSVDFSDTANLHTNVAKANTKFDKTSSMPVRPLKKFAPLVIESEPEVAHKKNH